MSDSFLELKNLKKSFAPGEAVLQGINLTIRQGEFVTLLGASGCGKTTTLRIIAGLEQPDSGSVWLEGQDVTALEPNQRDVNTVFQNYALYPHLTVKQNILFPLQNLKGEDKLSKEEMLARAYDAAKLVQIEGLMDRKPKALSGGQRQRVAIGRAMVRDSKVFLMDEPLSNLDAKLRNQMRAEIILLRKKIDTTFIYVTHDQTEAMTLGDRIVIMKDGFIQQVGTPTEVFEHPVNLFVAGFIGAPQMNTFRTELVRENGKYYVTPLGSRIEVDGETGENLAAKAVDSRSVVLGVRPEHITLSQPGPHAIPCTIIVNEMMGSELHIHAETEDGAQLVVRVPTLGLRRQERAELVNGAKIHVSFPGEVMHLFDPETERNLIYG